MPPELPNQAERMLGYFGGILGQTLNRASTADIWNTIKAQAANSGTSFFFGAGNAVSTLRGIAGQARTALETFGAANRTDNITSNMVWTAPWSNPARGTLTPQQYRVRFELTTLSSEGDEETLWKSFLTKELPDTVGGLLDNLDDAGNSLAAEYNRQFVSVGRVLIEGA